jgi:GWxTD domain-containing protein
MKIFNYRNILLSLLLWALHTTAASNQSSESAADRIWIAGPSDSLTIDAVSDSAAEFTATRDTSGLKGRYANAIELREKGKWRVLLFRKRLWNKSAQLFQQVIERDSLYRDVLYQYALLLRYRKDYEDAITTCHTQLRIRPELTNSGVKIFSFYRHYIAHTGFEESMAWLNGLPWDHAKHAMAENFRREERIDDADSLLLRLLDSAPDMPLQPVRISLAKINYQRGKPEIAERYFLDAVNGIETHIDADIIFEEMKYIVTDQELLHYIGLMRAAEKREFFRTFWLKRDPLPSESYNKRLAEHFRRLAFAEKHYEFYGFRGYFNNPDRQGYLTFTNGYILNEEYNDKGLIYIRHGEADDLIVTLGEGVPSNESWRYYRKGSYPEMTFHFALENSPGLWRVTPIIEHPKALEDRFQWGSEYYTLRRSGALERQSMIDQMANKSQTSLMQGLSHDRHTWDNEITPLSFPFLISTFRGSAGKSVVDLLVEMPYEQIAKELRRDVKVRKGFTLHDSAWAPVKTERETDILDVDAPGEALKIYSNEISPGTYHFALNVIPEGTDLLGGYKFRTDIADYNVAALQLSDILLADEVGLADENAQLTKNGLSIVPNIRGLFSKRDKVYIYYEIYHLSRNDAGESLFTIDYKLTLTKKHSSGLSRLLSIFGGKKSSITTRVEREGNDEFSAEYLSFDVGKLSAGDYDLEIRIEDRISGQTAQKTQKLELR